MKQNDEYLLMFAAIVIIPVVVIWYFAWPILRPWSLPTVVHGTVEQAQQQRSLTEDEVKAMNLWVQQYRTGWGVSGEVPPKNMPALAVYQMSSAEGRFVILSAWHFKHGDDVVGIQTRPGGAYRMRSFDRGTLHLPGLP
ncbi:hypothetical protein [Bombella saccharophila]|uniref:Uncharacterized protein n=1 Tax=Bombella saccharophila TaxID=2967338 RepID=A0ABT3WAH4_9PROT|nr:hypothetical protein [Bombella saccharophila]MCX5613976.1 hypothetical protein [Bombella saccharophila]